MNVRLLRTSVACIVIFVMGCASTAPKRLAVPSYDYKSLTSQERIFVITKDKEVYEMTEFTVTDTHIKGIRIIRNRVGVVIEEPEVEISLDDVEFVEVEEPGDDVAGRNIFLWVLSGIGIVVLVVLAACTIAALVS